MTKLGLSMIPGLVSGELLGFGAGVYTINPTDETRSTSETSFLQSAINEQANVQVYSRTSAQRIEFNGNKTATGVMVETAGYEYLLSAKKEVIVASGVVHIRLSAPSAP